MLSEQVLRRRRKVVSDCDIRGFREDVANGLRQTFLQALRTNQTRSKKSIPQVVTVELSSLSRVDSDNVLIQFAVLIDGQPMKAVDAAAIFNRLPDLIATLNENLPYQVSELKPFADMTDREMQRKADAERQRNKRRLREKQRQSQKTDLGETGMSQRPKAETQETNNKSTKKDEASKRKKNRKDKELAAWKRAQAQNSYGAPPMTAYPTHNGAWPWMNTPQAAFRGPLPYPWQTNSYGAPPMTVYPTRNGAWPWMNTPQTAFRGPLPYPWQTGPLPNTRHNAEFLRCIQNPFQSLYNPVPYSQDQSLIFSQCSDLPGSMQDDGDEASGSESKSTESNSPQSNQGTQTQTLSMNTETTYHPGLPVLSPGSGHYLQLLMSLASQPTDVAATQVGSRGEVMNKNKSQASPAGQFSEGREQARERRKKHNKSVASTDEAQGPLPNTRHNAEFLRCIQNPFQSLYNPVPYSQDQSLIFSQCSDLPGSMQDDGDEASGSESKSTESNSPQSNQGTQTQTLSMNTETTYHPGLPVLSPGSGHYLQLLMSLASQPTDVAATQVGSRGEVMNKNKSQASPAGQFSEGREQARERRKKHNKSVASTDEAQVSEEQTHLHGIGQQ
ncbi:UNVERIFIED_CONTAM: hypothetical protein FKN15_040277 [Acipenser sinensis]